MTYKEMKNIRIIGAGMAGLLASNLIRNCTIFEQQAALPNNHHAVLRFRSNEIAYLFDIPFKTVQLIKAIEPWGNDVSASLAYSKKCSGFYRSDRSINLEANSVTRYIAPTNFIELLASGKDIIYNSQFVRFDIRQEIHFISTIPMPSLMKMLGYKYIPAFQQIPGISIRAKVKNCEAYVSLIVPNPAIPISRISITGDEMIIELPDLVETSRSLEEDMISIATKLMGIDQLDISAPQSFPQKYFKIQPIDELRRKKFMKWASDEFNIYSLGRYACWRPGLLLDDLVKDIRKIQGWINGGFR